MTQEQFDTNFPAAQRLQKKIPEYIPTADEVNVFYRSGIGHDQVSQMICVEAKAKRLGVFGLCECCKGEGLVWQSDAIKKLAKEWKPIDPPVGDGFQLWSTITLGTPMTPVLSSLDELCEYCEKNKSFCTWQFNIVKRRLDEKIDGDD